MQLSLESSSVESSFVGLSSRESYSEYEDFSFADNEPDISWSGM